MGRVLGPVVVVLTLGACFESALEVGEVLPVADAGFDQVRHLGSSPSLVVELDGRASCDPQGAPVDGARFELVEGPSRAPIAALGLLGGLVELSVPGDYLFALRVNAGQRESPVDFVLVTVVDGIGEDVVVAPPGTDACGRPLAASP